jgi:hypothetical protein
MKTREPEALDIPIEKPRLLRKMVEIVYGDPVDYSALCADTRVSAQELRRMFMDYEGATSEEIPLKPNVIRFSKRTRMNDWPDTEDDSLTQEASVPDLSQEH